MSILPSSINGMSTSSKNLQTIAKNNSLSSLENQLAITGISSDQIKRLTSFSSASKLLGASITAAVAKFPSTSNLFNNITSKLSNNLASTTVESILGSKEADKKFDDLSTSLNRNTSSAENGAVTYTTNTSAISVEPYEASVSSEDTSKLLNLPSSRIAKLANSVGMSSINNDKELDSAETTAFNEFKTRQSQSLGNAKNLLSDVKSEEGGSVLSLTGSTLGDTTEISEISKEPDLTSFNAVDLNSSTTAELTGISHNYLLNTDSSNDVTRLANDITSLSTYGLPFDDIGEKSIQFFNEKNDYPQITDDIGQPIPGISDSSATQKEAASLYSLASTLCPNVNSRDMYGYSNNKNLFDYLTLKAASLGLSDLLMSLLGCPQYRDSRTQSLMQSNISTMSKNGDVNGLHALHSNFGSDSLNGYYTSDNGDVLPWSQKDTLLSTSANMNYNDENKLLFEQINEEQNNNFGNYCYTDNSPDPNTIDARTVAIMSNRDTYFADKELGSQRTETVLGVLSYYG